MGETEWIASRSAAPDGGVPYFDLQTNQLSWNTQRENKDIDLCTPLYPHVTVAKDVGIKCGDVFFLYKSLISVARPPTPQNVKPITCYVPNKYFPQIDYERIFVKGKINGVNYDFDQFVSNGNTMIKFDNDGPSFQVSQLPCQNGCTQDRTVSRAELKFTCDKAEITIFGNRAQNMNLASHTQVNLLFVDSSQSREMRIRDGIMGGGFCAGWPNGSSAPAWALKVGNDLKECVKGSNTAQTYTVKAVTGQP